MSYEKMNWGKKRFFEFRTGHSVYLGFSVSLISFVLIVHRLLIERIPLLEGIDLTTFTLIFAVIYLPAAILIGQWHFKHQHKVETTIQFMQNPGMIRAFRLILEVLTNSEDKEDVEKFKNLLRKLEKETGFEDIQGKLEKGKE